MIVAALNIAWVAIASSFVAPTHEQLDEQQTRDVVWSRSRALTSRLYTTSRYFPTFLPERDYITFGSLLSQFRLSLSVVCGSVTLLHPTEEVEPFGKISSPLCTLAIL